MIKKIVKFNDGTFALRKGFFHYKYLDLQSQGVRWWGRNSRWMLDCKGTNEEVLAAWHSMTDKGEVQ